MNNKIGEGLENTSKADSTKSLSRRKFLAGAGALAATVSAGPFFLKKVNAQGLRKVKYTLAWIPQGHHAFSHVARDLGFWKKRGLDVTVDRGFGTGKGAQSVGQGTHDFGYIDMSGLIVTAARGDYDLVSIAMVDHISPLGVLSLKEKNIKKPKDLEGKVYGTASGSGEVLLFPAFAKLNGIDESKVKIVYMAPSAFTPTLLEGQVDFIGIFYPAFVPEFWARNIPFNMILFSDYGLDMYSAGMITTGKMVKDEPELCQNMVDGILEALKLTYMDVEKTADVLINAVPEYKGNPVARQTIKHAVGINAYLGYVDYVRDKGLGWHKQELVDATRQKVLQYMDLKNAPPTEALYTNKFVGKMKLSDEEWKKFGELAKQYKPPA